MSRSPIQWVLPKRRNGFVVSELHSESEHARGLNPWNAQQQILPATSVKDSYLEVNELIRQCVSHCYLLFASVEFHQTCQQSLLYGPSRASLLLNSSTWYKWKDASGKALGLVLQVLPSWWKVVPCLPDTSPSSLIYRSAQVKLLKFIHTRAASIKSKSYIIYQLT